MSIKLIFKLALKNYKNNRIVYTTLILFLIFTLGMIFGLFSFLFYYSWQGDILFENRKFNSTSVNGVVLPRNYGINYNGNDKKNLDDLKKLGLQYNVVIDSKNVVANFLYSKIDHNKYNYTINDVYSYMISIAKDYKDDLNGYWGNPTSDGTNPNDTELQKVININDQVYRNTIQISSYILEIFEAETFKSEGYGIGSRFLCQYNKNSLIGIISLAKSEKKYYTDSDWMIENKQFKSDASYFDNIHIFDSINFDKMSENWKNNWIYNGNFCYVSPRYAKEHNVVFGKSTINIRAVQFYGDKTFTNVNLMIVGSGVNTGSLAYNKNYSPILVNDKTLYNLFSITKNDDLLFTKVWQNQDPSGGGIILNVKNKNPQEAQSIIEDFYF